MTNTWLAIIGAGSLLTFGCSAVVLMAYGMSDNDAQPADGVLVTAALGAIGIIFTFGTLACRLVRWLVAL